MSKENRYELKITLDGIEPEIWRRVLVSENLSLAKLHDVVQAVIGWWNSHLHQFIYKDVYYLNPAWMDDFGGVKFKDERRVKLKNLKLKEGDFFVYEYDFGDSWYHVVEVEAITENTKNRKYPVCLGGARACPPEDCGGVPGYLQMLETLKGEDSEEKREILQWLGRRFDPEAFSLDAANRELKRQFVPKKKLQYGWYFVGE